MPSVAGPKRPQDRIELPNLKKEFAAVFAKPLTENGFGKNSGDLSKSFEVAVANGLTPGGGSQEPVSRQTAMARNTNPFTELEMANNRPTPDTVAAQATVPDGHMRHGSVVIAAITSCTNTSNPSVMLAAGLLAKKAVERGLRLNPLVKASLAPGSRVVTDYLSKTGLQKYLDELGFNLVGYGCTTCIGNSGPLPAPVEDAITKNDVVAASVLSGNRNFEARIHQNIKANFLMSPPLVVAFALAGRVDIDLAHEPIGQGKDGRDVYLQDIWPSSEGGARPDASRPEAGGLPPALPRFREAEPEVERDSGADGQGVSVGRQQHLHPGAAFLCELHPAAGWAFRDQGRARAGHLWRQRHDGPHLPGRQHQEDLAGRASILTERGVAPQDFNSYGSRRGNDQVMTRGTFANVRIKNLMVPGTEGGVTKCFAGKGCASRAGRDGLHLRRRDGLPEGGHAAGDPGRTGVRHGQLARLGGQGYCPAGRQGRGGAKL